jgi:serine/threonine protein phosphatase 1
VIGDIHGAHKALLECFEKASFDRNRDLLICLGDVCDGWPEVNKVMDTLLTIKNLVYILGNHDKWGLDWFLTGEAPDIWIKQGGRATMAGYQGGVPESHIRLLAHARLYYRLDNRIFVHGGFDAGRSLDENDADIFLWDRSLVQTALMQASEKEGCNLSGYDEVYVGHTPTLNFGSREPIIACEVILMDTGAGWPGGVLTMMDIDNKNIYQSSTVDVLYPGFRGR